MIPLIRVKVRRKSVVQGKALTRFPALVSVLSPLLLDRTGGNYTFSLDVSALLSTLANYFQPIENIDQEITSGATANVNANSDTVRVNKTVGGPITLQLLPALNYKKGILISDWKGDAGTNNITIALSGSEKIQGQSSWVISADGGSVRLEPIPGVGFAI